jgi:SAM-dependent methyltransferase
MSDGRLPGADLRNLLRPAIPRSSSPQILADALVPGLLAGRRGARVMDLGCGRGDSVDLFRAADPEVRWVGVELTDSEEFAKRTRDDAQFVTFDGIDLPFEDGSLDVVFCKQVLEHVERPDVLLPEVARVLRPDGVFAGSTSNLEPYHGYSVANFTPYGLKRLLERTGFDVEAFVPGVDGLTLMARRLLSAPGWLERWWSHRSPLNTVIDGLARPLHLDPEDRNTLKLLVSGHYVFIARPR